MQRVGASCAALRPFQNTGSPRLTGEQHTAGKKKAEQPAWASLSANDGLVARGGSLLLIDANAIEIRSAFHQISWLHCTRVEQINLNIVDESP